MDDLLSALKAVSGDADRRLLKSFRSGTHRVREPAETFASVQPLLPMFGITRIGNITGLDRIGIPVMMVTRPNSRSLAVSQGKGVTTECATVSGVMESIEAWHAERIQLPLRLACYDEMRWEQRIVDPTELPRDATSVFSGGLDMLWVLGWDMLGMTETWVPYELVHTRFTLPRPTGSGCFVASSNGLASGNNVVEALCHALCEVIERDAVTLWQISPRELRDRRQIDLGTIDDPVAQDLIHRCGAADVDLAIWEVTSEVGVPTFYCQIAEATNDRFHLLHSAAGMGCHPSKSVALTRAITEAAQSRLTIIAGSRDDVVRDDYARIRDLEVLSQSHAEMQSTPKGRYDTIADFMSDDLVADLEWLLGRLGASGFTQVVAFDLGRPDLGLSVVRVVIPGMETAGLLDSALGSRAGRYLARLADLEPVLP